MSITHNARGTRRRLGIAHAARRAFRLPARRALLLAARRLLLVAAVAAIATHALRAQGPGGPGGGMGGRPGGPGMGMPGGPAGPGGPGRMPPPGGSGNNPGAPGGASIAGRMQGPGGRWWDDNRNAHSVGLTSVQQRRMDAIFQENRSSLVSGLDTLRKAQVRLDALSVTGHPSEAAMLTEIQNVSQARADLEKTYTHMTLQIRNEMTNDQLNKLEKLK